MVNKIFDAVVFRLDHSTTMSEHSKSCGNAGFVTEIVQYYNVSSIV